MSHSHAECPVAAMCLRSPPRNSAGVLPISALQLVVCVGRSGLCSPIQVEWPAVRLTSGVSLPNHLPHAPRVVAAARGAEREAPRWCTSRRRWHHQRRMRGAVQVACEPACAINMCTALRPPPAASIPSPAPAPVWHVHHQSARHVFKNSV